MQQGVNDLPLDHVERHLETAVGRGDADRRAALVRVHSAREPKFDDYRENPICAEEIEALDVRWASSWTPSEVAQRNELWDRIMALCPPSHHELLRLKLKGLTLAQIAAETGLHPNSVRRILFELAHRLATADDRSGTLRVD